MTPCAAKWIACCDDPHWRSIVVAGTDSGQPAASTALRPMLSDCSETCMTQPMIDVVDQRRVELVALGDGLERLGGQVDGVPAPELPVALAAGRPDSVDDDCGGHDASSNPAGSPALPVQIARHSTRRPRGGHLALTRETRRLTPSPTTHLRPRVPPAAAH